MAMCDNYVDGMYRRNRWDELIDLTVTDPNGNLPKSKFRLSRYKSMGSITKSYADVARLPVESLRFTFDGKALRDRSYPYELHMESGDVIHVTRKTDAPAPRPTEELTCAECSQPKCIPFSEQWWFG